MIQPNPAHQPEGSYQAGYSLVPAQDTSAEYYLNLGKKLYQSYLARSRKEDLDAAIHHFQKAVELEPNMAEAYVQLASALWDQGAINLELAQFYCETALRLNPRQAQAHLFLGYFLQRAGFFEEAVDQYRAAIRKNHLHSARPRIALGNTLLKQALQTRYKSHQLALTVQGMTHFALGCTLIPFDKQTCSILKEAFLSDAQAYTLGYLAKGFKKIGLSPISRKLYQLGTKVVPDESMFYHLLGDEYLYDLNRPEDAIEQYKKVQALEPDNLSVLKKLAKAYADVNHTDKAVEVLNIVVENDADFDSLYYLGQLHTEQQDYFRALYFFKEAEKHRPHYPYIHSNMAYVLFKMDDVEGAYEKYKIALEYGTDPSWMSTVAQTLGTICYQMFNEPSEALEYFHQSLHYHPENTEALASLADLYFENGQMELSLATYKTLLQIDPRNADCYSSIGYILWQMDKNEAAIDAYLTAIHFDADNPIAHNNLGVIYLDESNQPERALGLFKTALALKPDYTLACFNVARALEFLGQTMEAAQKYSQALELNTFNPELETEEIHSRLDRLFD